MLQLLNVEVTLSSVSFYVACIFEITNLQASYCCGALTFLRERVDVLGFTHVTELRG